MFFVNCSWCSMCMFLMCLIVWVVDLIVLFVVMLVENFWLWNIVRFFFRFNWN